MRLLSLIARLRAGHSVVEPCLCIESGPVGFNLLDVKQVEQSAREYFGANNVLRNEIKDRNHYLRAARTVLSTGRITHYWVDPRSGHQSLFRALGQSIGLALLLAVHGVKPIVWLTDVPKRRWRLQAEILSASSGVCFVLVNPRQSEIRLCGTRFVGPAVLPLSADLLSCLIEAKSNLFPAYPPRAVFAGSMYEPRASFLEGVRSRMADRGWSLDIVERGPEFERRPEDEYWHTLLGADVIVTTAMAFKAHAEGNDVTLQPHLIYRYAEALACRTALVAPKVPGADDVFASGLHYLDFESEDDCADAVIRLLENAKLRTEVAKAGHARLLEILAGGAFWNLALSAASAIERAKDDSA